MSKLTRQKRYRPPHMRGHKNDKNDSNGGNVFIISSKVKRAVVQYDEEMVFQLRNKVRGQLPEAVMSKLFTDCAIRQTMSDRDIAKYREEVKDYNVETTKRKIKGLCNKICDKTYKKISVKVEILLEKYINKPDLQDILKCTSVSLFDNGMQLLTKTNNKSQEKYKQLSYYGHVCHDLSKKNESRKKIMFSQIKQILEEHKSQPVINNDDLESYFRYKGETVNLFVLLAVLYNLKFLTIKYIRKNVLSYLEKKILSSNTEENMIWIEIFCSFVTVADGMAGVGLKKVEYLYNNSEHSSKSTFELMDLMDKIKQ